MLRKYKLKRKYKTFILFYVAFLTTFFSVITLSKYTSSVVDTSTATVAKWDIKINNSSNAIVNVNLNDTITTNNYSDNYVAPGSKGDITLVLDFTNNDVLVEYTIGLGTYSLPNNLHFYSDSACTISFSTITATHYLNDSNTQTYHIYWKWDYQTDSTSNANDNLYMNQSLDVPIVITMNQGTVIANE